MIYYLIMITRHILQSLLVPALIAALSIAHAAEPRAFDLRGTWVGNAKGPIFGAEGSVTITHQRGEQIHGVVEGGNFLGKAKFDIAGKVRGNYIVGEKEGNYFQGFLYADGTIRGAVKAIDGEIYRVFLRRPAYPQWGGYPYGGWYQ
ncbi:MAG: hypothetical protein FJ118_08060 [Deltaproteobacteria bacterium]|nr:hypothetical protein [Deltaproteobacteria bacterium]